MFMVNQLIGFGARGMQSGGGGGGPDPHFANVVLLCGFNGADGATTTIDDSSSAHSLTFVGNAQIDTAQSKFGGASLLLDGAGDAVTAPNSTDFRFGAGQFTVEAFLRLAVLPVNTQVFTIAALYDLSNLRSWYLRTINDASVHRLQFWKSTNGTAGSSALSSTWTPALNTWYHIACDRDASGVIRLYLDGAFLAKVTDAADLWPSTAKFSIGAYMDGGNPASNSVHNGWLDEVRITKGVARYASDAGFTVPTAAYPRS